MSYSREQEQTMNTFSYKWSKTDTYSSDKMYEDAREWLMEKYFDGSITQMEEVFRDNCTILDAGCGAGFSIISLLGKRLKRMNYIGVDISDAVKEAEKNFGVRGYGNQHRFMQCDLNSIEINGGGGCHLFRGRTPSYRFHKKCDNKLE